MNSVSFDDLRSRETGETSTVIRERVVKARAIQRERFKDSPFFTNSKMQASEIDRFCRLDAAAEMLLKNAMDKLGISTRGYSRILKVSRTIADVDGKEQIECSHSAEAIQYYNRSMFNDVQDIG